MVIYYCEGCGARVPAAELEAHTAVVTGENKALCAKCAAAKTSGKTTAAKAPTGAVATLPAPVPETRQSRANIRPVTRAASERHTATATHQRKAEPAPHYAPPAAAVETPPLRNKLPIIVGAGGLVLFVIGLAVAFRGDNSETAAANAGRPQGTSTTAQPGGEDRTRGASAGAAVPGTSNDAAASAAGRDNATARTLPSWMSTEPTKAATTATATPVRPTTAAVSAPDPVKTQAIVVPTAPNETVWSEDALPGGAAPNGTLKGESWKWVTQPAPVFSGTHSHTQGGAPGQEKADSKRQHCFEDANPPLPVNPADTFFVYVYLDPKDPPKEIMLEWKCGGNWDHRAYWGDDLIPSGNNLSPSRLPVGPLPKEGEWVRLEVRASEIGVEADDTMVSGWAFDQVGGTVYWDRAGLVRAPKNVATTPARTEPPAQAAIAAPQPKPAANLPWAKAAGATAGYLPTSLKKWRYDQLNGRNVYGGNFGGQKSTAIWAKTTPHNAFSGTFDLAMGRYGPGELITFSFLHNAQPCLLSITVNGQEIYSGRDKATARGQWREQRYPIPSGVLRFGKNEFRICNTEPQGKLDAEPWYMLNFAEIQGSLLPDLPPLVSEAQRNAMQAYERVFDHLAKKDLDPAAKIDQALRLAKSVSAPELQPLAGVLEKAQALYNQAVANLAKKPPTEQISVEKLKLKGTIVRIAGGKAYVKSEGMEMPVDVALLPPAMFQTALAFDDAKPESVADKAAYSFGLGNIENTQQLLKRLKKEETPAWARLFEQRGALERLLKFESSVGAVEAALKDSKPADALSLLNGIKKDYADLADANKERMAYLTTLAEGPKK
ncbi:MAG: hypothetical protein NTW87_21230 [Planctomycetota bacterium]|nr:hypothetical protein [Planctomycetota bacterium]